MARELRLEIATCDSCGGNRTIANPAWAQFLASLTPEKLAAGAKSEIPQRLACDKCRGLGKNASADFWLLVELIETALAGREAARTTSSEACEK